MIKSEGIRGKGFAAFVWVKVDSPEEPLMPEEREYLKELTSLRTRICDNKPRSTKEMDAIESRESDVMSILWEMYGIQIRPVTR